MSHRLDQTGSPGAMVTCSLVVNGEDVTVHISPDRSLLSVLRDDLGLTGAKEACGRGECGACTVLVDGVGVLACLELAVRVSGSVTTPEQVALDAPDVCEAFADAGGLQCGFCTPGQIVRAAEIVGDGPPCDEAAIRVAISGNICRCTGYAQIVDAVLEACHARWGVGSA